MGGKIMFVMYDWIRFLIRDLKTNVLFGYKIIHKIQFSRVYFSSNPSVCDSYRDKTRTKLTQKCQTIEEE